jgi:hypothetical protein
MRSSSQSRILSSSATLRRTTNRSSWDKICGSAPLSTRSWRLRPRDLSNTAVALQIASDAHALEVSRRAGPPSALFTPDRYEHLFPEAGTSVADCLDGMAMKDRGEGSHTKADVLSHGQNDRRKPARQTRHGLRTTPLLTWSYRVGAEVSRSHDLAV